MLSDDKFYEKAKDFVLLQNTEGKYYTIEEYKSLVQANQTNKSDQLVLLYTTDADKQHAFVEAAHNRSYDVLKLDSMIDSHFIGMLEQKLEKVTLKRVDSETIDKLIERDETKESVLSDKEKEDLKTVYEQAINNTNMIVEVAPMSPDDAPVVITMPEFMRRMKDMSKTGGGGMMFMGNMPDSYNVTVNANHPLNQRVLSAEADNKTAVARQAFDLALLSQNMLSGAALTAFVKRSFELMTKE
jgi:molecular chaperone HtpG